MNKDEKEKDLLQDIADEVVSEFINVIIPARIKKCRKDNNLTQKEFAQNTGLSVRTIQRLESGSIKVEYVTILKIEVIYPFITEGKNNLQQEIDNRFATEIKKQKSKKLN